MDELKLLIEALDRMTTAQNRTADAGFAIAHALAQPDDVDDEGSDILDAPRPGRGMGMG